MARLTQSRLQHLLTYCAQSGVFVWNMFRGGSAKKGSVAGRTDTKGYIQITVDGVAIGAHRLAFLYMEGVIPDSDIEIDHINGDRKNNAWWNLRRATKAQNQQNLACCRATNKSSGLLGVSFDKESGKWRARITVDGRLRSIGRFATAELAHAAYCGEKVKHHTHNDRLKGSQDDSSSR